MARLKLLAFIAPLFLLSACGEGWEMQLTQSVLPYGNARTAGSGVIYVRAKLMPKKELKLEQVAEQEVSRERVPELTEKVEEKFNALQRK